MDFGFSRLKPWRRIVAIAIASTTISISSLAKPVVTKPGILGFGAFSPHQERSGLFTVAADGRNRHHVKPMKDIIYSSIWSPNGKRLAFTTNNNQDVYVINADGSRLITVLQGDVCKAASFLLKWTVDSEQLVFVRSCDGSTSDTSGWQTLYVRNLAQNGETKLVQEWKIGGYPPANEISSPVYPSPDGRQVSFIKNQNLFRMNSDGSGLTQLTDGNQKSKPSGTQLYWSPDSRKIARLDFFSGDQPIQEISIFSLDGRPLRQWRNPGFNWITPNLIWSPDSRRVAFYYSEILKQNIYLYDLAEAAPRKLTRRPAEYSHMAWSPDGQQIASQLKAEDGSKIYILAIEQERWANLTSKTFTGEIQELTWSPNSQQLAFTVQSLNSMDSNLYVMNRDATGLKALIAGESAFVSSPAWQP